MEGVRDIWSLTSLLTQFWRSPLKVWGEITRLIGDLRFPHLLPLKACKTWGETDMMDDKK